MRYEYECPDWVCYFCGHVIHSESDAYGHDVLVPAEWACYAAGHIKDFDKLGGLESVCPACAERLVGPDWLDKGRAAIAEQDAFWQAARAKGEGSLGPASREIH